MCICAGESRAEVGRLEKSHKREKNRTLDMGNTWEREGQRKEGRDGKQLAKTKDVFRNYRQTCYFRY